MDLGKCFLEYRSSCLLLIKTEHKWLILISCNILILENKIKQLYFYPHNSESLGSLDSGSPMMKFKKKSYVWVLKTHPLTYVLEEFEFKKPWVKFRHKGIARHFFLQKNS